MFFSRRTDAEQCNVLQMWHIAVSPENIHSNLAGVTFMLFCNLLCFTSRFWPQCVGCYRKKQQRHEIRAWSGGYESTQIFKFLHTVSSIWIYCWYLTGLLKIQQEYAVLCSHSKRCPVTSLRGANAVAWFLLLVLLSFFFLLNCETC